MKKELTTEDKTKELKELLELLDYAIHRHPFDSAHVDAAEKKSKR